jgi:hypothetical protein
MTESRTLVIKKQGDGLLATCDACEWTCPYSPTAPDPSISIRQVFEAHSCERYPHKSGL